MITQFCMLPRTYAILCWLALTLIFVGSAVGQNRASGMSNPIILQQKKDVTPPTLTLFEPRLGEGNSIVVAKDEVLVRGVVTDEGGVGRVEVNGRVCAVGKNGGFSMSIALNEGPNTIMISAEDKVGNPVVTQFNAIYDSKPPVIEMIQPRVQGTWGVYNLADDVLTLRGKVIDEGGLRQVLVNGKQVPLAPDSTFTEQLPAREGTDTVTIAAFDVGGHKSEKKILVNRASKESAPSFLTGKNYGLMIGIDAYKGDWDPLINAVRDAKAVEDILESGFRFEKVYTLYDDKATRSAIIRTMEDLGKKLTSEDNLLIYYSGHGVKEQPFNKGFWVPVDATERSMASYISNDDIQTLLRGMRPRHVLLVADACFAGDIFRGLGHSLENDGSLNYYKDVARRMSRKGLTSGGDEPVLDGGKNGHSVFAYYFLRALQEIDGRFFDAGQVFEKLRIPVGNNSDQKPEFHPIKNTGDEGGQFIFERKK